MKSGMVSKISKCVNCIIDRNASCERNVLLSMMERIKMHKVNQQYYLIHCDFVDYEKKNMK